MHAFADSILVHLRLLELDTTLMPARGAFALQPELTPEHRAREVDWIMTACDLYRWDDNVLFRAVAYLDRYLSTRRVTLFRLRLVTSCALMLASKYEDTRKLMYADEVREYNNCEYSLETIHACEDFMFRALGYRMGTPTAMDFLPYFLEQTQDEPLTCQAAHYGASLAIASEKHIHYPPSAVAIAAIAFGRFILGYYAWSPALDALSWYDRKDPRLKGALQIMLDYSLRHPTGARSPVHARFSEVVRVSRRISEWNK